jgi:hypothetical protein
MFFNENGILNIDELVVNSASFKKMMEDGLITESEIKEHSDNVIALLQSIEQKYTQEQLLEIRELLVETAVLYAVYNVYSIQVTSIK